MTLTGALRSNPELSQRVLLGEATSGVFLLTTGQDAGPSIAWLPPAVCHQQIDMNCKGLQTRAQTNMPQNVGSKEDLIRQNIQSRHFELCKADHTTWKLTLQDINTAPKEPKRERLYFCFGFFRCRVDVPQSWNVVRSALQNLMCHQQALVQLVARRDVKWPKFLCKETTQYTTDLACDLLTGHSVTSPPLCVNKSLLWSLGVNWSGWVITGPGV